MSRSDLSTLFPSSLPCQYSTCHRPDLLVVFGLSPSRFRANLRLTTPPPPVLPGARNLQRLMFTRRCTTCPTTRAPCSPESHMPAGQRKSARPALAPGSPGGRSHANRDTRRAGASWPAPPRRTPAIAAGPEAARLAPPSKQSVPLLSRKCASELWSLPHAPRKRHPTHAEAAASVGRTQGLGGRGAHDCASRTNICAVIAASMAPRSESRSNAAAPSAQSTAMMPPGA